MSFKIIIAQLKCFTLYPVFINHSSVNQYVHLFSRVLHNFRPDQCNNHKTLSTYSIKDTFTPYNNILYAKSIQI